MIFFKFTLFLDKQYLKIIYVYFDEDTFIPQTSNMTSSCDIVTKRFGQRCFLVSTIGKFEKFKSKNAPYILEFNNGASGRGNRNKYKIL